MTLQKLLFDIFQVTTLSFSNITLLVLASASKMAGGITYKLFTMCHTAQQVNQIFIDAIKTMLYFISFFSGEASSDWFFLNRWDQSLPKT